jgi:hypothetical protein
MKPRAPAGVCRWNKPDWKKTGTAGIPAGKFPASSFEFRVFRPITRHSTFPISSFVIRISIFPFRRPPTGTLRLPKIPCALRCQSNRMAKSNNQMQSDGSNLHFEAQLWGAADKMSRANWNDISRYEVVLLPKLLSGELRVPIAQSGEKS